MKKFAAVYSLGFRGLLVWVSFIVSCWLFGGLFMLEKRIIPEVAIFAFPLLVLILFNAVGNTFPAWATKKGLFMLGALTTYRWEDLEIEPGIPDGVLIRIKRWQDAREVRLPGRVIGAVYAEEAPPPPPSPG